MQACQGLDDLREAAGEVIASTSVEPHLRAGRDRGFHSAYDFLGFALHSRCRHQEQIEEVIKAGRNIPQSTSRDYLQRSQTLDRDLESPTMICHREPTLKGILSDPIVRAVMEADGVNPLET